MREVSSELFHLTHAIRLVALDQHGVVSAHHLVAILMAGLVVSAGREILRDLAEDPRIRRGRAADHDRIAVGLGHHAHGVFGRVDIAVSDDRDAHGSFHFGDARPIGLAAVALLARAGMQREGSHAAIFGQARQADRDELLVVPAGAELDGERNGNGRAHLAQQPLHQGQVAQQAGAAVAFHHFVHRAAEVDIHHVEAQVLADARGIGHDGGIGPEQLRGDGALHGIEGQVLHQRARGLTCAQRGADAV